MHVGATAYLSRLISKVCLIFRKIALFSINENGVTPLNLSEFGWGFILFNGQEPPKKMEVDDMLKNDSSFYQIYHYAMLVPDSVK